MSSCLASTVLYDQPAATTKRAHREKASLTILPYFPFFFFFFVLFGIGSFLLFSLMFFVVSGKKSLSLFFGRNVHLTWISPNFGGLMEASGLCVKSNPVLQCVAVSWVGIILIIFLKKLVCRGKRKRHLSPMRYISKFIRKKLNNIWIF